MALNVHLIIIDPQLDFMGNDDGSPYTASLSDGTELRATLPVQGAVADMKRGAALIDRICKKITDIHLTLDSHRVIDVGHPGFWRNSRGESPAPFTLISKADIQNGIWVPRDPTVRKRMIDYADSLETHSQYRITVWPEHCLIGSWGHTVQPDLAAALQRWERSEFANVDYVVKGTNYLTEHYGALMAEVPDPADPDTELNSDFLETVGKADIIGMFGEASSHCLRATIQQIADHIGDEHLKKFHILTDCTSPVGAIPNGPNFPEIAKQFFGQMAQRGMILTTSAEFLA